MKLKLQYDNGDLLPVDDVFFFCKTGEKSYTLQYNYSTKLYYLNGITSFEIYA